MIIFDFDQTLVDTSPVEEFRSSRQWGKVMARASTLAVYEGIPELLNELHAGGHSLAIVTKSPDMVPKWFIKNYGWPVDIVVGFHDVKQRKPHPEGLLLALRKGGASADASYHVGDQSQDTEAARAAGITSLGVTWGINDHVDLRASAPDHMFASVEHLAEFFRRVRAA